MEQYSKKITILFSPELHERLVRLADQRGTSMGEFVRTACEEQYGLFSEQERLDAVILVDSSIMYVARASHANKRPSINGLDRIEGLSRVERPAA